MTRFGLTLTNRGVVTGDSSLEEMYDLARRVDEDERFTSIWVGDSITAKPRLDALSLMSALAARTDRVRIGPGCFATTPVRPPILLAYQLAAIDVISSGRLTFAACMGAADASEFDHFCIPPITRSGRMEEAIEIIRRLTRRQRVVPRQVQRLRQSDHRAALGPAADSDPGRLESQSQRCSQS